MRAHARTRFAHLHLQRRSLTHPPHHLAGHGPPVRNWRHLDPDRDRRARGRVQLCDTLHAACVLHSISPSLDDFVIGSGGRRGGDIDGGGFDGDIICGTDLFCGSYIGGGKKPGAAIAANTPKSSMLTSGGKRTPKPAPADYCKPVAKGRRFHKICMAQLALVGCLPDVLSVDKDQGRGAGLASTRTKESKVRSRAARWTTNQPTWRRSIPSKCRGHRRQQHLVGRLYGDVPFRAGQRLLQPQLVPDEASQVCEERVHTTAAGAHPLSSSWREAQISCRSGRGGLQVRARACAYAVKCAGCSRHAGRA